MFLMLYSINWQNFIVWLALPLEILQLYITIVCLRGCDVIKFEIDLVFLIKPFCYMTKKSRQKFKYLENEKSFWGQIKSILKWLLVVKNYPRPESARLILKQNLVTIPSQILDFSAFSYSSGHVPQSAASLTNNVLH